MEIGNCFGRKLIDSSSISSDLYTILPLASTIYSLSLNPLPISNSFTSPIHLFCGILLSRLPYTFTNLSSPILSICPIHFNTFLSILSSTLNSQPHLSLIIELFTLSILLMQHMFLKRTISNSSIFSSTVH